MPNTISLPLYHPHSLSSAINRSCDWYRHVSTRYLRLFNDSYGGFAPRTYHRLSLIAFISYLGGNMKLVLRITTEQKSSTAIRVWTSCYWDSFDFIIHQHPPLPIQFLCQLQNTSIYCLLLMVCIYLFNSFT